jgi:glycosidase
MITESPQSPRYPSLYQINTRVWLTEISRRLGRAATLDDIPDADLDRLRELGFDWVWFLSVWQTGEAGQRISRSNAGWRREFEETLPDLRDADIAGSGFAIRGYTVHSAMGGDLALARLRKRLEKRGLRLMLDFVPNHMAPDHPWVEDHPDYFIPGTELDLARTPENFTRIKRRGGDRLLAYGRDPFFAGWPDTLQLNYGNLDLQDAMVRELVRIAGQCDGVRCDMAMLVLPEVFERTWGIPSQPFWLKATERVRERYPSFCFMAEAYWDLEWTLQQQGFDFAYDKRLYDRLRDAHARPVREHFWAGLDYQDKLARFLENHDEPRAAATFPPGAHEAAAVISYLAPGLRFFHHGQLEGHKKRISPHLIRAPEEPLDQGIKQFYERLLSILKRPAVRDGRWTLLECHPAWEGNATSENFIAFAWHRAPGERLVAVVNYAPEQSQCYVPLPFEDLSAGEWLLEDLLGTASYDRDGDALRAPGLFLDVPPWNCHVFQISNRSLT